MTIYIERGRGKSIARACVKTLGGASSYRHDRRPWADMVITSVVCVPRARPRTPPTGRMQRLTYASLTSEPFFVALLDADLILPSV